VKLAGTLCEKTRVIAAGHPVVRLDAGEPGPVGPFTDAARRALDAAGTVLVSDYGHGVAAHPELREILARRAGRVPVVWDPHPRGPAPVPGVRLACPNLGELRRFAPDPPAGLHPASLRGIETGAAELVRRWRATAVAG